MKLFKRVAATEYESGYEVSDALIERIAMDTQEPWEKSEKLTPIQVALKLAAGEAVTLSSPFSEDPNYVRWTMEPALTGNLKTDEAYLLEGKGDMWEVRVISSLDEMEYVEFEVRAETMEEAATKAETVARLHADFYFGDPPEPTYRADRHNIYRMDEEDVS